MLSHAFKGIDYVNDSIVITLFTLTSEFNSSNRKSIKKWVKANICANAVVEIVTGDKNHIPHDRYMFTN